MFFNEVKNLLYKEIVLEWRQRYALNGIMLYLASTIFICYLSFNLRNETISPITWNALFWIILLFTAINAIAKSFIQESQGRLLYYYTLFSAEAIITSKIIYNGMLMTVLSLVGFIFYSFILGNPIIDQSLFIINLLLGAFGFSTALTMISSIASKAHNSNILMSILGFPVIIPMLLLLIKVSKNAMDGLDSSLSYGPIVSLLAINMIVVTISYFLFPYLWRS